MSARDEYDGSRRGVRATTAPPIRTFRTFGRTGVIDAPLDNSLRVARQLLWGDSNPGNFLFGPDGRDSRLRGRRDRPGRDRSRLVALHGCDARGGATSPSRIPDEAEQVAAYEAALGRRIVFFDYYTILAAVRMSLVMARIGLLLIDDGKLHADNDAWRINPAVQRLA